MTRFATRRGKKPMTPPKLRGKKTMTPPKLRGKKPMTPPKLRGKKPMTPRESGTPNTFPVNGPLVIHQYIKSEEICIHIPL